jgi:hypothetical protein
MRRWYLHDYGRCLFFVSSGFTILWLQDAKIVVGLPLMLSLLLKGHLHSVRPGQSLCTTARSTIGLLDENKLKCSICLS